MIFDCDGVLVNSERIGSTVLAEFATRYGWSLGPDEATRLFKGGAMPQIWRMIEEKVGRPLPGDIETEFRHVQLRRLEEELQPIPGVLELLESLTCGFCVASNGPHEKMQVTLRVAGLLHLFQDRIFSRTDVSRAKPFPDLFEHAAERCGVDVKECLVIEDSLLGVQAARAAGMRPIAFVGTCPQDEDELRAAGAEAAFSRMSEVERYLSELAL